ncbi:MAG TPA: alpha/beta fold hydrolase [Candidatus Sulfotelmatobacter sp.]|nr:alpha/beta fold hydrolase [Candidatus Sulfotelmatobacter sp.]
MSKITLISDGYKLSGHLLVANEPKDLSFLLIQGWAGHQNIKAAQLLADLGYTSMTYDMRGNGESEGNLTNFSISREDFVNDATEAYDFLKMKSGTTKIGVIGSSFGSYTGVMLTKNRKVYCLCLRVPAIYSDEGYSDPKFDKENINENPEDWRTKSISYSKNHALKTLHDFNGKVLIIEAEKDELVPSQVPRNYANAVKDKSNLLYKVMKKAPHRLENDELQSEYEKLLVEWINKDLVTK